MKKQFILILVVVAPLFVQAQSVSSSGSFDFLNEVKTMQVKFNYDNVAVGDFKDEKDYVAREVTEKNDKEPGTGEIWREKWYANRANRFEPNFIELFNKYGADFGVSINKDEETKYVMKVVTTFIDPGWNVGVMRRPALVDFVIMFYDNAEPSKVLGTVNLSKCPGKDAMGYDFDAAFRMEEAYAKGAKSLAKFLKKKK